MTFAPAAFTTYGGWGRTVYGKLDEEYEQRKKEEKAEGKSGWAAYRWERDLLERMSIAIAKGNWALLDAHTMSIAIAKEEKAEALRGRRLSAFALRALTLLDDLGFGGPAGRVLTHMCCQTGLRRSRALRSTLACVTASSTVRGGAGRRLRERC